MGHEGYEADEAVTPPVSRAETVSANRGWWDAEADAYQLEHGAFLGDDRFTWSPEGLDEASAGLLGAVAGRRTLEIGCGAAQCSRWLAGRGATVVGVDLSAGQLAHARAADARLGTHVPVLQAEAGGLPFAAESFDLACSAFGALPFVADIAGVQREVARVLRPGGRWVFSVSHPLRWAFPDDAGPDGLTVRYSYFDRSPYVERDESGQPTYVEHHHTIGDWVRAIVAAGLVVDDLVEPEWPEGLTQVWGGWSPLRGRVVPGTAVLCCTKPSTGLRPA